jgi:hypothetical protein
LLNEHNTLTLGVDGTSPHTSPYHMDLGDMEE